MPEFHDEHTMRVIGTLEAQAKSFETAISVMNQDLKALRIEVKNLSEQLAAINGGRRAIWGLLAGAGALGALISSTVGPVFQRLWH